MGERWSDRVRRTALGWWLLAGIVASTSCFVFVRAAVSIQRREAALGRRVEVVVARRDLPLGTVIAPADLDVAVLRGGPVVPGALRTARRASGRTVRVPLLAGAVVTGRHLTRAGRSGTGGLLPPDRRAVRVEVPGGPSTRPGDVVDLIVAAEEGAPSARVVLEGALVLAVDTGGAGTPPGTTGVVLQVTPDEARQLAAALTRGVPVLAVAPPEAARP